MGTAAFKAASDFLFSNRTDYHAAHDGFQWPQLDHFNCALDWFDAELAYGENADRLALKIVGEGAGTATFAELSASSNRIANGLRAPADPAGSSRNDNGAAPWSNVTPNHAAPATGWCKRVSSRKPHAV
jgi:acetyl-CoA synthetase